MTRKSRGDRWWKLFGRNPTRRQVLRAMGEVGALVTLGGVGACAPGRGPGSIRFRRDPFTLGVASGDPDHESVVLWTRLDSGLVVDAGLADATVDVRWEVAVDDQFRNVVAEGRGEARADLGHSAHVVATGLRPSAEYWYRFHTGGVTSPLGRTRTAPSSEQGPGRLRFAFASCQNYEHGHFTALRHLAGDLPDVVLHLGDYIYEARFASGSDLVREHEAGEVTTLDGYRSRYDTYRRDPDLQAAHAAAPWIVTFDDHEVDNNWAGFQAEDDQSPEAFALRRAAAFQAWYEFMPLRPRSLPRGPDVRVYRAAPYGRLATFFVLDTRQHRADQPCGDRSQIRCDEAFDPAATMLGPDQERWLVGALDGSPSRWNVLANQVMVSSLASPSDGEVRYSMDRWDGYVAARDRLTAFLGSGRVPNPVIVTGDIHTNWVADVKRDFDDPESPTVATELVGTSLTSGGDGRDGTEALSSIQSLNPHIHHFDARRGYVLVELGEELTASYRRVSWVTRPGAPVTTSVRFVVEDGVPGAWPA